MGNVMAGRNTLVVSPPGSGNVLGAAFSLCA